MTDEYSNYYGAFHEVSALHRERLQCLSGLAMSLRPSSFLILFCKLRICNSLEFVFYVANDCVRSFFDNENYSPTIIANFLQGRNIRKHGKPLYIKCYQCDKVTIFENLLCIRSVRNENIRQSVDFF